MAYAALASLAQTVDLILNYHHDSISPELSHQIIAIHEFVTFFRAFLDDFPGEANSLEGRIRELTHSAEDIVEILLSEQIHGSREPTVGPSKSNFKHHGQGKGRCWKQIRSRRAVLKSIGSLKSKLTNQPREKCEHLHHDLLQLTNVTEEIESIAERVMEIKNGVTVKDARLGDSTADSSPGDFAAGGSSPRVAPIHNAATVGLDDDLMAIKYRLCGESSKLEVVPIVGMGGIGKTTLARNTYEDPLITEHFPIRVWVTVSQDYRVQDIVSALLVSTKLFDAKNDSVEEEAYENLKHAENGSFDKNMKFTKKDSIQEEAYMNVKGKKNAKKDPPEVIVYKNLKGRRYLIVLDDIWSVKAWDDLKKMFPDDNNGSRIMLTTRLPDVASYPDSFSPLHEMCLMDDHQSWNLLQLKVVKHDTSSVKLEYIGKSIAKSCRGLPLAIVVISGILSTVDQTEVAWENIARNVKSAISANAEQFDKILSLSYTHLPHHLRPCFLYMGGFPEDCELRASELIRLWVAEGFLKPNGCNKSFEETAEQYLEDLVKRNLVMVTKRKSNGKIRSLIIHDLMREMCLRKAQEDCFFSHARRCPHKHMKIIPRHILFRSDLLCLGDVDGSTIRTIVGVKYPHVSSVAYFRLLRILDLLYAYKFFYKNESLSPLFPAEVFELFHLRYLAFDCPFRIPPAISNLQNLQTLVVGQRNNFCEIIYLLPQEIWRMPQLRHLISYFRLSPFQEIATSSLENLQTLSVAINLICSEEVLKMIPNLKKLGISFQTSADDEGTCDENYQLHNLVCLQQLEILKLVRIYKYFPYTLKVNPVFPRTLKKLTLSGLGISWEDMNIVGSLPNLEVLKLRDHAFIGESWETSEGEFSQLTYLLIDKSDLQYWIIESSHFPKLKCVELRQCLHLREIPDDIGEIPTLELIVVDYTNEYLVDCIKQMQVDQQSYGNYTLQVRFLKG